MDGRYCCLSHITCSEDAVSTCLCFVMTFPQFCVWSLYISTLELCIESFHIVISFPPSISLHLARCIYNANPVTAWQLYVSSNQVLYYLLRKAMFCNFCFSDFDMLFGFFSRIAGCIIQYDACHLHCGNFITAWIVWQAYTLHRQFRYDYQYINFGKDWKSCEVISLSRMFECKSFDGEERCGWYLNLVNPILNLTWNLKIPSLTI